MTMRNRKTVIVAFMLVVCMLLAVGYAAVTLNDELLISGDATITADQVQDTFDENIHFNRVSHDGLTWVDSITTSAGYGFRAWINAGMAPDQKDTAEFAIQSDDFASNGDTMVIWYEIINEGDLEATQFTTQVSYGDNTDTDLFDCKVELEKNTLAKNETMYAKVTVRLKTDPPADGAKGNFVITIDVAG